MTEREFAAYVVARLRRAGYEALWAGGCVRDELLGLEPSDYDIATSAPPEQVCTLFRRTVEVGLSFGVVEVLGLERNKVQVATFRSDGAYSDGRRPDTVTFSNAEEDAKRRDFTVNGMFFDPERGEVIDYVGGRADLQARVLRAIGDPFARFAEDKLRMLRAVRFAARFDLSIDPATAAAIRAMADQLPVVSPERIAEELRKILVHPNRRKALTDAFDLGLMRPMLPELTRGQFESHLSDAADAALNASADTDFSLAFALLFQHLQPTGPTKRGAAPLGDLCRRLKFSNDERARIEWLVKHRDALQDAPTAPFSTYQPILIHPGIRQLLAMANARPIDQAGRLFAEALLAAKSMEELDPPPLVTGDDLIALGIAAGPRFKELLQEIRNRQLDGEIREREEALRIAAP